MKQFDRIQELALEQQLYAFLPKENFSGAFESLKPVFKTFSESFDYNRKPIITVGGTNGKGETCFALKTLLENNGYNVAVFTSPHILSIQERFYFCGSNLDYSCLSKLVEECSKELANVKLSFYEFLFYMFCKHLKNNIKQVDYVILEVGLGGRKDTVNLLNPSLCALTSISRDHQEILGKRYDQILKEKLGITRAGIPLVSFFKLNYLNDITRKYCKKHKIPNYDIQKLQGEMTFDSYSLRNKYQAHVLYHLLFNKNLEGFPNKVSLIKKEAEKGRFEMMTLGKIRFIFIGAHNIDGIRLLEKTIYSEVNASNLPFDEFWISFSKRDLKDIEASIKIFKSYSSIYKELWMTSFTHNKAFEMNDEIKKQIKTDLPKEMNWVDKLTIMDRDVNKTIAIAGSYYFIGEIQKQILGFNSRDI